MIKIDLKKNCGLPLFLSNNEISSKDFTFRKVIKVTVSNTKKQLLTSPNSENSLLYTKYIGLDSNEIFRSQNVNINIFLLPSTTIGIEFIKTIASLSNNYPRIIEIIQGNGIIIMQNTETRHVKDVIVTKVKPQQKIIIPSNYSFSLINTKSENLIALEIYSQNCKPKRVLDQMKGLSYYVIEKNKKLEIVGNPRYKILKKFRKVNLEKVIASLNISPITPITKQILRKYDKFEWLFEKNFTVY